LAYHYLIRELLLEVGILVGFLHSGLLTTASPRPLLNRSLPSQIVQSVQILPALFTLLNNLIILNVNAAVLLHHLALLHSFFLILHKFGRTGIASVSGDGYSSSGGPDSTSTTASDDLKTKEELKKGLLRGHLEILHRMRVV
jgi:hypothetical protein